MSGCMNQGRKLECAHEHTGRDRSGGGGFAASGEAFDMDALTAAHPKLPFGSWVRVRNVVNGRSVDVRINDRGPYIKRRIIDLSRAAAQVLGLASVGARQVEIALLHRRDFPAPLRAR